MTDLSLNDMLQIMDVARELRSDRELVSRELSHEETVARLRERLLAATQHTGEQLTPAEVDAAIELYFDNLYTYREPPFSLSVVLAHLYIRRRGIGAAIVVLCGVWLGIWLLAGRTGPPPVPVTQAPHSSSTQPHGPAAIAESPTVAALDWATEEPRMRASLEQLRSLTTDEVALRQIESLSSQLQLASTLQDVGQFTAARESVRQLTTDLNSEYEVRIVREGRSAARRDFADETGVQSSRYYVIVEALSGPTALAQWIENAETGERRQVTRWGEEVPENVYERLKADKQADGILDERVFAIKQRGKLTWEVQLQGVTGTPLSRASQILEW